MIIDLITKNSFLEQTLTQEQYDMIDKVLSTTIIKKFEKKENIDLQNWCNLLKDHFQIILTSNEMFLYIMRYCCLNNLNVKIDVASIIIEKGEF